VSNDCCKKIEKIIDRKQQVKDSLLIKLDRVARLKSLSGGSITNQTEFEIYSYALAKINEIFDERDSGKE
jgi:hypothetical protein